MDLLTKRKHCEVNKYKDNLIADILVTTRKLCQQQSQLHQQQGYHNTPILFFSLIFWLWEAVKFKNTRRVSFLCSRYKCNIYDILTYKKWFKCLKFCHINNTSFYFCQNRNPGDSDITCPQYEKKTKWEKS